MVGCQPSQWGTPRLLTGCPRGTPSSPQSGQPCLRTGLGLAITTTAFYKVMDTFQREFFSEQEIYGK